MSGKPVHSGHVGLIKIAASECDQVKLYVSISDRARPGEVVILGADMQEIWTTELEKIMPRNVAITYGGSPIANAFKEIGEASKEGSADTYVLYADDIDLQQNFPDASLKKYAETLFAAGQIEKRPVKRTETVNVSGTKMREYLSAGDSASFIKNLPNGINGKHVWSILHARVKNPPQVKATSKAKVPKKPVKSEQLIRSFVEETLKG